MRGGISAISLFRLVVCAGFLCVAWVLLSPGEARAEEPPHPSQAGQKAHRHHGAASQLLNSVDATAASVAARAEARPGVRPEKPGTRARDVAHAVRPLRMAVPVREAVQPLVVEAETAVRGSSGAVTATLAAVATPIPVLESVDAVDRTVRAVTDGALGLAGPVVPPPVLPALPAVPDVVAPDRPAPDAAPAASPTLSSTAGDDSSSGAVVGDSSGHLTVGPSGDLRARDAVAAGGTPRAPFPGGGPGAPAGMPLGTSPSSSSAGSVGGHGASADAVLGRNHHFSSDRQGLASHGDLTIASGPGLRPGSRPD